MPWPMTVGDSTWAHDRSPRRTFDGNGPPASNSITRVIYCVVPEALADDLLEKLSGYYADDPNVTVIVDRRKSSRREIGARGGGKREVRDRRRPRIPGELPELPELASD
jgi:hypothetical protein